LRLKLVEAKFWQSLAVTEKITINGQTIQFEDSNLKELSCDEFIGR
jgi:hypothetical protein